MIEEKLKIAAEKLPVPQSTFKSIVERAAQKAKEIVLGKELAGGLCGPYRCKR